MKIGDICLNKKLNYNDESNILMFIGYQDNKLLTINKNGNIIKFHRKESSFIVVGSFDLLGRLKEIHSKVKKAWVEA
jgi:hypothetical protein